jgi:hypothetical protein
MDDSGVWKETSDFVLETFDSRNELVGEDTTTEYLRDNRNRCDHETIHMTRASTMVVEKIANHKEMPPTELSPQLHSIIDPDALDALLETDAVQVEFTYAGYRVTVNDDGDIHANPVDC